MKKKKTSESKPAKRTPQQTASLDDASQTPVLPADPPGRTLTWWHPLFAGLLLWELRNAYEVTPEMPLSQEPLRADVFLVRRKHGRVSPRAMRDLPSLIARLNRFTLIEFKGPTDSLRKGDLQHLMVLAFQFHGESRNVIPCSDVTLVFVAPAVTSAFRRDVAALGLDIVSQPRGVHQICKGRHNFPFAMWVLETNVLAEGEDLREPILTLLSPSFLRSPRRMVEHFTQSNHEDILYYAMQQIEQFSMRDDFRLRYRDTETMSRVKEDLKAAYWNMFTAEERLQGVSVEERLKGVTYEERLKDVPVEERLKDVPVEERLKDVPVEERLKDVPKDILKHLLKRIIDENDSA